MVSEGPRDMSSSSTCFRATYFSVFSLIAWVHLLSLSKLTDPHNIHSEAFIMHEVRISKKMCLTHSCSIAIVGIYMFFFSGHNLLTEVGRSINFFFSFFTFYWYFPSAILPLSLKDYITIINGFQWFSFHNCFWDHLNSPYRHHPCSSSGNDNNFPSNGWDLSVPNLYFRVWYPLCPRAPILANTIDTVLFQNDIW